VKRLMDVSDPVPEKFQRCELLCLVRVVGRQDNEVFFYRRRNTGRRTWACIGVEPIGISRQVQKVLACSLPWVIRPHTGLTEGVELLIVADQFLDLGARAGLSQAKGYFTDDSVTLITPRPSIAADWKKHHQRN
jgi:hypothetical protein